MTFAVLFVGGILWLPEGWWGRQALPDMWGKGHSWVPHEDPQKKQQESFGLKRRKLISMLSLCFSLFSAVTFRFQWCSGVLKSEVPSSHQKIHFRCNDVSSWYQTRPASSPSLAFMSSEFGLWLVLKRSWPGDSTSFLNTQEAPYQTSKLSSLSPVSQEAATLTIWEPHLAVSY